MQFNHEFVKVQNACYEFLLIWSPGKLGICIICVLNISKALKNAEFIIYLLLISLHISLSWCNSKITLQPDKEFLRHAKKKKQNFPGSWAALTISPKQVS